MIGHIYLATNRANGKVYVGQTYKTVIARWQDHVRQARRGSPFYFHAAIRKYGPHSFLVEEIGSSKVRCRVNVLETTWILLMNSHDPTYGYNLTLGGEHHEQNRETRLKMHLAMKGRIFSKEHRAKISAANKGRVMSPEWRKKLGDASRGKKLPPFSEEHRKNISLACMGRRSSRLGAKLTAETKAKLSLARKGKPISAEHRAAISAGLKGRVFTAAHRKALGLHSSKMRRQELAADPNMRWILSARVNGPRKIK